jgi:Uma2 family endonuclease
MVQRLAAGYVFDPADPRAPTVEQWTAMGPEERERVLDMLPSEPDVDFLPPPEGDDHWEAGAAARITLGSFFRKGGRRIYISGNLAVYYPGERLFSPDLIAVVDVELHPRLSWSVAREGKGLDLALEIHVAGDRAKDLKANVDRYARLGIHEYFVFDRGRLALRGYRLPPADPGHDGGDPQTPGPAGKPRAYLPLVPQGGRLSSEVLGLDLMIEGAALRFYHTTAPLLDGEERMARLERVFDDALRRAQEADEGRKAAEERASELEREVAALREELARLKGGGSSGGG